MAHRLADGDGLAGFARQRAAGDNDPRGRVPDSVLVFSSGPPGVQRYRDRADLDGGEERGNHLRPVHHQQDDAFLEPDAELAPQGRPDPVHLFLKVAIRQPAIAALDRHRVRPPFVEVTIDEVGGGVVGRRMAVKSTHAVRLSRGRVARHEPLESRIRPQRRKGAIDAQPPA